MTVTVTIVVTDRTSLIDFYHALNGLKLGRRRELAK